ncbi:MAG: hypothetical protein AABY97_09280 [Chloroflexota bacterium]
MARGRYPTIEEIQAKVKARLSIIKSWGLALDDLETMIAENPHVYSPISGFLAEYRCRQLHLTRPEITDLIRPSGYNKADKGDFTFTYKAKPFRLEVKSLDGPSVVNLGRGRWEGTFQCNASDQRKVTLPNKHAINTNCIVAGGWDVLAVNLYAFGGEWRFAFARQVALPRASDMYTPEDRPHLLASSMKITLPLAAPYTPNLTTVLDAIVTERRRAR